ncbi:hypothetical protein [Micromonospora echinofusca]|uniref:Right handed beta helix region n=1 Tax=Micromonospora echinofusca TaxID=47858 RepID=A0ABS3VPW7_MICEH|nr:hypothetical protein [Micromonospora echinofusca]MBO4206589.1 hypothetical protein [Micromonospora echinofusca]
MTRDGTVIEGQQVAGYIHVRANNVTIRDTTVRYGGSHAVRVFDGYTGTTIERSKIYCTATKTNGIVFGGYAARQVDITGCRNGFMHSSALPATIVDSTWNGTAVSVGDDPVTGPDGTPDGYPGPDSTGVPAGTSLRRSGSLTLDQDGQVVTGLDIVGCVTVTARNVVIRKSRITCADRYSVRTIGAENLLVEDVEIDGQGRNSAAVCCGDYTLRRVDVHDVIDGPRLGDRTVVEDSWIHHLTRQDGSHNDTLQTTGATDILVRGNRLDAYNPDTRDPFNACLMIGSTTAPLVADLTFERNYCNGGNYSLGVRDDLNGERIVFRDNVFGRDYRFGIIARPNQDGLSWDSDSNVWLDTRLPVVH